VILAFLAACGGENKKNVVGTPHTPAKDCVLCTPALEKEDFGFTSLPEKTAFSALLLLRNKKADKTFVDRDEVASKLRGTTHFEPACRDIAHDKVRNIRLCLSSTWFVR
jgi:hypothetical protein